MYVIREIFYSDKARNLPMLSVKISPILARKVCVCVSREIFYTDKNLQEIDGFIGELFVLAVKFSSARKCTFLKTAELSSMGL